uniref:Uncharacterized protein n=1 Tax=Moschus moschiferus TaxID=68415 RepID=A0A8C6CNZ5_MOSMO
MAAAWTLVLVAMGLGLARARAVPTTTRKGCNTGMFKSLLPGELVAFKKEKDENSLAKDWDCTSYLFPRTRDLKHLQVWERPGALGAELVLTLKGPGGRDYLIPGPCPGMGPHLSVPSPISHTTLFCAWVWAQPAAGCRPQGFFQHWLQQLQEAPETSQDSLNLFHLLTWDVNCVTRRDVCI